MITIKSAAVVGSGTMGQGIAQVIASKGIPILLYDNRPDAPETAIINIKAGLSKLVENGKMNNDQMQSILANIKPVSNLIDVNADIIIEAIVELLEPKQILFKELAATNSQSCIFATNTSSIPVTRIAAGVPNPERVVGMHFFNPAAIMKLVEVISGAATSKEIATTVFQFAEFLGKTPVYANDSPGFIVNRVARHYYVEALKILEDNVTDLQTIDRQMESLGFKMGPFKLMDLIGVDTNFSVTSAMFQSFHFDPKFRPSRIQQQKVDAGHFGRKTGKGFYTYE